MDYVITYIGLLGQYGRKKSSKLYRMLRVYGDLAQTVSVALNPSPPIL